MYHLSVKPISRSAGRSATAAAAYRAGAEIADLRTGEVHDYTRKRDIVHSEMLVPPGSPPWAEDRAALWNAAEAAEKRKDARVARDYEVAIPKELTREQGIALVREFAQDLVDRYGVAVDFNIHRDDLRKWDGSEKGWQGYHAHILTSTRKLGRDGFGEKADPELSDTRRKGLGLGDGASEVARVRELWEISANRHLEQANQAQRIDRRTLKGQGVDREPTVHLGPHATDLERRGIRSDLGDINRRIEAAYLRGLEERRMLEALDRSVIDIRTDLASAVRQRDDARKQPQGVKERWVADALADFRTRRERGKSSEAHPGDPEAKLRIAAEKVLTTRELLAGTKRNEGREPDRGRKDSPSPPSPDKAKKDLDRGR